MGNWKRKTRLKKIVLPKDVCFYFADTNIAGNIILKRYNLSCKLGLRKVCKYGILIYEYIKKNK